MKSMVAEAKIIGITLIVLLFTMATKQESEKAIAMAKYQTDRMNTALELDEEQSQNVASINLKYAKKMNNLMETGGNMFSKMGDMKKIKKGKNKELKKVLTHEQMEKYEEELEPEFRKYFRNQMNK
ncbi:hypothetical protein [Aquimarina sp. MMG016]|uniref:hypothetical protein n=1 Tax=Aquimarina sp. MMG016 TaxID=2822690 RepID=UPI001B3A3083|nr:hypothetical protein [Aquimarina sp. MMG016]MBQ4819432.1 hypothetical protein [Aquimarina sp. MMG016]